MIATHIIIFFTSGGGAPPATGIVQRVNSDACVGPVQLVNSPGLVG